MHPAIIDMQKKKKIWYALY